MQRSIPINDFSISWPGRILAALFAALFLLFAFTFGALALGVGLVLGLGVAARLWWLRRRWRRRGGHQVIEGEYLVLERHATVSRGTAQG